MPFLNKCSKTGEVSACGLVHYLTDLRISVPVPLKSVKIDAKIVDFISEISLVQEYVNRESVPIEAVYMFPVEEESAVVEFEAELDGRTIKTTIKEKEEARKEYDDAVRENKTAFLLEETKPDIFQIKVGHLKPGSVAKVTIKYISELTVENRSVRLTIPTTIAPRYVPLTDNSEEAKRIAQIPYELDSPAPLSIELKATMKGNIKNMTSPSHDLKMTESPPSSKSVRSATLTSSTTDMDRDFIVLIESEDLHNPVVFLESDEEKGTTAGMVSLVPSFNLKEQNVELIFLVDRSGSMTGSSMQQASKALQLFLHSVPASCLFNIYSFGSHFDSLFGKESAEYTDQTLEQAKKHAAAMEADYGGTEILQPLEQIFKVEPRKGFLRQIFVLTDGEVSNDDQVIALVKKNSHSGRVFTLGLGNSCSRHLVKGIARAGGGTAVFAAEGEDLRPKVMAQLKNSLQPAINDVKVEWIGLATSNDDDDKDITRWQAPRSIPPIYDGSRMLVYRLFPKEDKQPTGVKVTAETPDGPLSVELKLDENSGKLSGRLVHRLAARKRIQDLEESSEVDADKVKEMVVALGKEFGLASKHTSFIGVDPKDPGNKEYEAMVSREVANQIAYGYGGFGGGGCPPMAMQCGMKMMRCMAAPMMSFGSAQPQSRRSKRMVGSASSDESMECDSVGGQTSLNLSSPLEAQVWVKEEKEKPDLLSSIIDLQGSSGVFRWGQAIETAMGGMTMEETMKKNIQGLSEEVWITALVVVYLEEKMGKEKELWELVAEKARKFVGKNVVKGITSEMVFKKAEEVVKGL